MRCIQNTFAKPQTCPEPTDDLPTGLTDVCIEALKASTAARLATLHDILLGAEGQVTLQAAKVLFMPAQAFRLHALRGEDQLKRGGKRESPIKKEARALGPLSSFRGKATEFLLFQRAFTWI